MKRNPYVVALLSVAGIALVIAYMLWIVISQLTDYETWDAVAVGTLTSWGFVLVTLAGAAIIGSVTVAGVGWSLRQYARTGAGDSSVDESVSAPSARP